MTFIVPVRDLSINWESAVDHIKDKISHLTGYEKQILKCVGEIYLYHMAICQVMLKRKKSSNYDI